MFSVFKICRRILGPTAFLFSKLAFIWAMLIRFLLKKGHIDEDTDLLDWFTQSLHLNGKRHKKLLENGVSSLADKLFMKEFDSYETIKTISFDLQQN